MERLVPRIGGLPVYMGTAFAPKENGSEEIVAKVDIDVFKKVMARLAAYEETGLEPERVAELAQAEKDGRLVVLPCKVGDIVLVKSDDDGIYNARVQGISISATGKDTILHFGGYPIVNAWGSGRGKTWFLTNQEAEEALRKEAEE